MSNTPKPNRSIVVSTFPDTGTALWDAGTALCVAPVPHGQGAAVHSQGSLAPATTNVVVDVSVVPVAVWALATTLWRPESSGVVGVYTQLPLASAVTVVVVPASEWITIVTVLPGGAVPRMTGCDVVTSAFWAGERICKAEGVDSALPDAGSVGVSVGVSVAVGVAVGVALSDAKFVPEVLVPVPVTVIFAGVVPTNTLTVGSLRPPTNVLDTN